MAPRNWQFALREGGARVFRELRPARYWLDAKLYRRTAHAQALSILKGRYEGGPMLVVANGPSLNRTPLDNFSGTPSIGMNKIDLLFPRVRWRPSMVVCMNRHVLSQNQDCFDVTGIPLYLSWQSRWFVRNVKCRAATLFLNLGTGVFSTDITVGVGISGTVTYAALQFAYYMGADPVILVGLDHFFHAQGRPNALVVSEGEDRDHFAPAYFGTGSQWNLPDLEASERGYRKALAAFAADGRTVLDATVGGKLTIFDKISVADAIRITRQAL